MPLKSPGLETLPNLMRLHTSGCSAHSADCSLGSWCDPLPRAVFECCLLSGVSPEHPGTAGKGALAGRQRSGSRGAAGCCGVCRPRLKPRVLAVAAGTSVVSAPPERGRLCGGAWDVLMLSTAAIRRHRCCWDSRDKPCFSAEHSNSDVPSLCCFCG